MLVAPCRRMPRGTARTGRSATTRRIARLTPLADDESASSRRDFLQDGGIAAAGLVVGGAVGAAAGASIGHALGLSRRRPGLRRSARPLGAGLRPRRRADGREPLVRQPARLALHAREPADGPDVRRPRVRRLRERRAERRADRRPRVRGRHRRRHGPAQSRSGRGVSRTSTRSCSAPSDPPSNAHEPDRQHGRRRSTRRRRAPRRRWTGSSTTTWNNVDAARSGRAAARSRSRPDHGGLLARAAARPVDPGARVRGVRRLVRRRAVADLLQPLVLPRVDLARLRDEQARRRLRQVARCRCRRRRSSTASTTPASRGRSTSTRCSWSR